MSSKNACLPICFEVERFGHSLTFKPSSLQSMHHWCAWRTGYFLLFKNHRTGYLEVIYEFQLLRTAIAAALPIASMNLGA